MALASLIMSFMGMVLLVQSDPCPRCNSTGRYNGFQCTEMKRQRDIVPINGSILLMNITSGVCSTLNVTIDDKNVLNDEWATNCQSCYLNITCKTSALYKFKSGNETLHEVKCDDDPCPRCNSTGRYNGFQCTENTVCTNTYMSIDCGDLRIHILDAVSGKSRQRSPPCHMTPGDETFNNSFAVSHLWKQCNMRPNCHVFLNDGHYYTYVFIKYQCIKEIPAFDICSSLTSSPLIKGHLFSPGYPLMIPRQHPTKCTCRIALHSLINLRMDIMTDELRCPEKQRINVFSRNKTLESSYTCQTFNKSPLYIYNGSDIVFEFINKYYAAGGKFWIQFSADKHITVACGSSSSTPIAMSKLANVLRVPMTDDTQSMTTISPKTESRDQEPQVIPEFHIYHGDPKRQAPQFGLVFNILIVSTVLLAFTITLYICWQNHTRKNKGPSHSRQELPTKVI